MCFNFLTWAWKDYRWNNRGTDGRMNRWMDGWTNRWTMPLIESCTCTVMDELERGPMWPFVMAHRSTLTQTDTFTHRHSSFAYLDWNGWIWERPNVILCDGASVPMVFAKVKTISQLQTFFFCLPNEFVAVHHLSVILRVAATWFACEKVGTVVAIS